MIEIEQARDLLLKAVATQGRAFVYNPGSSSLCTYTPQPLRPGHPEGVPVPPQCLTGCLVGVALDLAGETRHHGVTGNVTALTSTYPDMLSDDAASYFWTAQKAQDNGSTWGAAFDEAERVYRERIAPRIN